MKQYAALDDTIYLWFASNDTSGSGGDGASPAADVRLAGAAADAAPVYSPTPALLSHVNYPAGSYEIAITASAANGFATNNTYAVFCTLAIDTQNPTGFVGSFDLKPVDSNMEQCGGSAVAAGAIPNAAADAAGGLPISDAGALDLDTKLANTNEITAARMGALTDWINGGRLDLILDIIAADTTTDIPALIATAQADLDTITGADGVTLATAQALYAPNKVVPDAAGVAATPAEVATALSDINLDHLVKIAVDTNWATTVHLDSVLGHIADVGTAATFSRTTDALEAIRDRGDAAWSAAAGNPNVLIDTTIATLATQTSFTLTAGSDIDDAYKDQAIVLYDASNNDYPSVRKVSAYTGATKTVTLDSAPDFTAVPGDGVKTFVTAPGTTAPTVGQIRAEMEGAGYKLALIEADTGELQTDWVNGGRLDLLLDAIPTTAMRGTDSANTTVPDVAGTAAALHATTDGKVDVVDAIADRILTATEIRQAAVNDAAATTTKFITNLAEAQNDFWNRMALLFTSGNNSGQMRRIKDYVGATKEVTLQTPLDAAPANADTFIITTVRAFITPDIEDIADAVSDELTAEHTITGSLSKAISDTLADVTGIAGDAMRGTDGANTTVPDAAGVAATPAEVATAVANGLTIDTIADSYATDGAQPTIAQGILAIQQMLQEKAITGTTLTVKKPDGSTVAMTFTLDSATAPTSITRAT